MVKYSDDFKLKNVQEYLSRIGGFHFLTHKHGISSNASLGQQIRQNGEVAFTSKSRGRPRKERIIPQTNELKKTISQNLKKSFKKLKKNYFI